MSQMTDDMARNVVSNWERNRTRYGLTAWEECQLARKWLSAADAIDAQAERIKALEGAIRKLTMPATPSGYGYVVPTREWVDEARALLGEK